MLLVRTYVARSTIEGLGAFARHDIRAGKLVWRFMPGFDLVLNPALARVCDREFIACYAQTCPRTGVLLVPTDNARFINHSDHPNLVPGFGTCGGWCDLDAARVISAGEELTCDYRVDDADPWAGFGSRQLKMLRFSQAGEDLTRGGDQ